MSDQNAQRTHGGPLFGPDSIPNSQSTPIVPDTPLPGGPTWALDQNALLFNIALQKAEHDFQHKKRKDAAEEDGWITTTIAHRAKPSGIEEDGYTSEIPTEVKALASRPSPRRNCESILQPLPAYEFV